MSELETTGTRLRGLKAFARSVSLSNPERKRPCPNCTKIARIFKPQPRIARIVHPHKIHHWIASLAEFRNQTNCPTCLNVVQCLQKQVSGDSRYVNIWFVRYRWKLYVNIVSLDLTPVGPHKEHSVVGVAFDCLDRDWIDVKRVKEWAKFCDESHSGVCHSITDPWWTFQRPEQLYLIGVTRRCLVRGQEMDQYVALSYVWGDLLAPFQTDMYNFNALCQDGAFDIPANKCRLPKTIQDSMVLAGLLGKKLWVDRFCIVQDDLKHKPKMLKSMASVYANAYLTIVARDGSDDEFGLRGIATNTPRKSPFRFFDFGPDCQLITTVDPVNQTYKYDTRAWTFQEEIISRRKLDFVHGTVNWTCEKMFSTENMATPSDVPLRPNTHRLNILSYASLVKDYSKRQLSYPEDTLDAFGAITTIASKSMKGGIFYGLL
ncbi:hypothetical protein BU16DRAFT_22981 [Lophium mytilinum]|uniref:Heterokaryon incompatibility domain-containing protein n=1 Tax=Lophium mytilinum TaxID=390894 RepID=A0A6A6RDT2_9PEZI|nr:hypothetical protein BU16DRAFT_22981 [Lophium mytilinum]